MSRHRPIPSRPRGFTLFEVLIALAVVAIGMVAVVGTAGRSAHLAALLRDDSFAHWVAMNELATLRLSNDWPDTGTQDGDAGMGDQKWHWQATISKTPDPDLLRVDIDVSNAASPGTVVRSLTGFIGRSGPVGNPVGAPTGASNKPPPTGG